MILDQYGRPTRRPNRAGAGRGGTMAGWNRHVVHPLEAERQMEVVANRARDLYTNDAMAHGIIESLVVEVVGAGLTPQPSPVARELGWSPERAQQFVERQQSVFRTWGLGVRKSCDRQRRMNFYQLQAFQYFSWRVDGIGAAQIVYDDNNASPSTLPLTLLPLDAMRIQTPSSGVEKGKEIYDGVEIDSAGRPVAIWIMRNFSRGASDMQRLRLWDETTGLPLVLLTYSVRNVAEYRQDSILGSMLKELRDNADFVGAAVTRAMLANMFVAAITSGQFQDFQGEADLAKRVKDIGSGLFLQLGEDESLQFLENNAPGSGFKDMFQGVIDRLGMATLRGPENVARKYQASYSASRASMVKADQVNAFEHLDLVSSFCQPAWCWMGYAAALRGLLGPVDIDDLALRLDDYLACEWLPQPRAYLDPSKTAAGHKTELEIGTDSLHRIAAEKGLDWRVLVTQRAEERAFLRQEEERLGLSPVQPADETPMPADDKDNSDDDSDKEDDDAK